MCVKLADMKYDISSVRRLYGDSTLWVIIIESIMHIGIFYDKIKNKIKNKNNIYIRFILCVVAALQRYDTFGMLNTLMMNHPPDG